MSRSGFLGCVGGLLLGLASGASFAACDSKTAISAISWTTDLEPLLHNCLSCHTFEAPANLMMAAGLTYLSLVGAQSTGSKLLRIEPGDPERSYLIHKLRGTHLAVGGEGERMPIGFEPLPEGEIRLFADWIKDCSPNN